MQTLVYHFKINSIFCFSGGTQSTKIAKPVLKTLDSQGFKTIKITNISSEVYAVKYEENREGIIAFSKEFFHNFNPKSNFIAIVTCSQANEECPLVLGADTKITLTYEDPKKYDNTAALENQKYAETSVLIATELYLRFIDVKK
ncbi:MAG: hypothetical protein ACK5H1_00955 [Tenacibaculum sp.]